MSIVKYAVNIYADNDSAPDPPTKKNTLNLGENRETDIESRSNAASD
jgi:hypothetical protein